MAGYPTLDVGAMDQRVTLFSRSVVADAMGQDTITWVDEGDVWAARINQRSAEAVQAAQIGDDDVVELHIRYRADVLTTWRLEWGSVGYDIVSATSFGGRKDRTRLIVRRGVKDGR
jgi:SPP1 family predicted phage head-tail adaptor